MHKKIDLLDLDIPVDDIECWRRYPKYRWMYDLSRLLDTQNIKWSPFKTAELQDREANLALYSCEDIKYETSYIYINKPEGDITISEIYAAKGEIKLLKHIDKQTSSELQEFTGNIELRINAFMTMHFQKFTGVITLESIGNTILSIRLRPCLGLGINTSPDIIRLLKKIYKKIDITI